MAIKKKRLTKAEKARREKISESLKKYHRKKKREALKRNNARPARKSPPSKSSRRVRKTPLVSFTVKRRRSKVKAFPKKGNKEVFFYADKRYYELDVPIIIESEIDIRRAVETVNELIQPMLKEFRTMKKVKNRLINIGYHIGMSFSDSKGRVSNEFTVLSVSYLESFIANSEDSFRNALEQLKSMIATRFNEYIMRQGFYELALFGYETEISNEGIF